MNMVWVCPVCGTKNPYGETVCRGCGYFGHFGEAKPSASRTNQPEPL